MPQRRINDAQTERLLSALQSLPYRQELARKLATKENIKYSSAMRRLQRYVTTGAEKRSFAASPIVYRRETVRQARSLPVPADYLPQPKAPKQLPLPGPRAPFLRGDIPPVPRRDPEPEFSRDDLPNNYEYRALLAYFDGDAKEAMRTLLDFGAPKTTAKLLELAALSTDILGNRDTARLGAAVLDWYDSIGSTDVEDIRDFSALLANLPEWEIEIILEDLANGDSTFADWMDTWRDAGLDFDDLLEAEDNEYWRLWRAAYARSKA